MASRRVFLLSPLVDALAKGGGPQALEWQDLSPTARALAPDIGLKPETWSAWRSAQQQRLEQRVAEGTAEHVTYYFLQSRAFCAEAPLEPAQLAQESPAEMTPAAQRRADAYRAARPGDERHRLLARIHNGDAWPLPRCYRHTMAFLRAKEVDRRPLDDLYHQRGLSSDTAPTSVKVLERLPLEPKRILLAGPGLDFTRREKFDDALPMESHQLRYLRGRFPQAAIDCVDVRPEVLSALGARRVDITTEVPPGSYDLAIATNLLLYFDQRELLTALASLTKALAPGGYLLHNEQRFAAKVFAEALGLTMEKFEPLQFAARKGIEQWDRAVLHRKP